MAYDLPTPAELKARYPAFAAVSDLTLQYWLTDAERYVDETWLEGDYKAALIAAAAHNAVRAGVAVAGSDVANMAGAGITDFQSASLRVRVSDEAVKAQLAGGWGTTNYGQEYFALLRKNKAGPRVVSGGTVPCDLRDLRDGTYLFP